MREFGKKLEGESYLPRPGAYGLILDHAGRVALVKTLGGYFLPGGGIDKGESPQSALAREVREECGFAVSVGERLGEAVQYVSTEGEGCFAKHCVFFRCTLEGTSATSLEPDHDTMWSDLSDARRLMTHESQAWALGLQLDATR